MSVKFLSYTVSDVQTDVPMHYGLSRSEKRTYENGDVLKVVIIPCEFCDQEFKSGQHSYFDANHISAMQYREHLAEVHGGQEPTCKSPHCKHENLA